jgi:hydroxypyruvate isomerase
MIFNEVDFLEPRRSRRESRLFPYTYPKEQLAEKLWRHRLMQVLHNPPGGNRGGGERGITQNLRVPMATQAWVSTLTRAPHPAGMNHPRFSGDGRV